MSQTQIAVPTGTYSEIFIVEDDHGIQPLGDVFVCDTVCNRGTFVIASATSGVCTPAGSTVAATAIMLGFLEQNVVANGSVGIDPTFGQNALQYVNGSYAGGLVTIWQVGRFYVTAVTGVIGDYVPVYPGANGTISATQTAGSRSIGYALKGNGGVSGNPVVVEMNLLSSQF